MKALFLFMLIVTLCFRVPEVVAYQIPQPIVQRFPGGFNISIAHQKGVERVAFNVNRNRPFRTFEQGDFSEQIRSPTDGKYVFEVKKPLNDDDIIYVWLSVQFEKYIYRKISEPISIRDGNIDNNSVNKETTDESNLNWNEDNDNQRISPTLAPTIISTPSDRCEPPLTKVTRQKQKYIPRCRGEQIFSEEFNGNELNTDIWTAEVRLPTDLCEDEFVLYNVSNIEVRNDLLSVRATLWNDNRPGTDVRQGILDLGDKCTEISQENCIRRPHSTIVMPPVISGRINTKSTFSFQYGRVVARVKFPQGDWLYPLLLLEPSMILINDPLPCVHVRIAFTRGNDQLLNIPNTEDIGAHRLSGGVVFTAFENNRNRFMVNKTSLDSFSAEFHIYEMIWNEEFLIFKIDQEEYGRIRITDLSLSDGDVNYSTRPVSSLLDREFGLTLGVAAGGHADFPDRGYRKPWTNTAPKAALNFWRKRDTWLGSWINPAMQVDYIRVYAI